MAFLISTTYLGWQYQIRIRREFIKLVEDLGTDSNEGQAFLSQERMNEEVRETRGEYSSKLRDSVSVVEDMR